VNNRTDRLERFRAALRDQDLDGALISHPTHRFYFSGFTASDPAPDGSVGVLLIGADIARLLTTPTNAPWAAAEAVGWEIEHWARPWEPTVATMITDLGWHRVGFEEHALTVATHRRLLDSIPTGIELVALEPVAERMRARKDAGERQTLEAALAITDDVFQTISAGMTSDMTERQLAWAIERGFRDAGASGPAFATIVAAGPHAARPHHAPSDRPLGSGQPVIIDMGALVDGYHGDLTRTVWFGQPSPKLTAVYNVVDRAQRAALRVIGPGVAASEVDAAARAVIEQAGYGEYFTHGLGHGIGVRIHEAPSLAQTSSDILEPGNVVTIEPGIYVPGWGGVRIEDVGVVESDGFRVVTRAPKNPPSA